MMRIAISPRFASKILVNGMSLPSLAIVSWTPEWHDVPGSFHSYDSVSNHGCPVERGGRGCRPGRLTISMAELLGWTSI